MKIPGIIQDRLDAAHRLLVELEACGFAVSSKSDRIIISPALRLTPALRDRIIALKPWIKKIWRERKKVRPRSPSGAGLINPRA